jgi:hypothetical protein
MVAVSAEPIHDGWRCHVTVAHQSEHTEHVVTVSRADLERWSSGFERPDVEDLVQRSFDFLLEREPPSSILKTFELSVIERYFPEYDRTFSRPGK